MFTAKIYTLTDAEIEADIAMLRMFVSTGHINGIYMDWDTDAEMKGLLKDYEEERDDRAETRTEAEQKEAA